ncbi:hypothetical protein BDB01DRAFT_837160 [Pilobolus umbonatus]|nr:hypothetical protein BDB01DRAFT_837160 [Pilobolus umbonatus]
MDNHYTRKKKKSGETLRPEAKEIMPTNTPLIYDCSCTSKAATRCFPPGNAEAQVHQSIRCILLLSDKYMSVETCKYTKEIGTSYVIVYNDWSGLNCGERMKSVLIWNIWNQCGDHVKVDPVTTRTLQAELSREAVKLI